jgi:hypothetical protein
MDRIPAPHDPCECCLQCDLAHLTLGDGEWAGVSWPAILVKHTRPPHKDLPAQSLQHHSTQLAGVLHGSLGKQHSTAQDAMFWLCIPQFIANWVRQYSRVV